MAVIATLFSSQWSRCLLRCKGKELIPGLWPLEWELTWLSRLVLMDYWGFPFLGHLSGFFKSQRGQPDPVSIQVRLISRRVEWIK